MVVYADDPVGWLRLMFNTARGKDHEYVQKFHQERTVIDNELPCNTVQ